MSERMRGAYDRSEFAREAERLAALVWDAMGVTAGERVLLCGYGPDPEIVKRAVAEGAEVTVIESRDEAMKRNEGLGARVLRGSTSAIPAKINAFDLAVANSYLHEIDPLFHANVVQELGRAAKRVVIVEPLPPSDALGKRIATLYSRAKRELGQFEYYQAPSYWRKLLSMTKPSIAEAVFAFSKAPPREYLVDTIDLLLETMRVEAAPQYYIDQLREIARQPGGQLLPQGRLVLVGLPEKGASLPAKSMAAMLAADTREPSLRAAGGASVPGSAGAGASAAGPSANTQAGGTAPGVAAPTPPPAAAPPPAAPASPPAPQPPPEDHFRFGMATDEQESETFGTPPGFDQPPPGWRWEPPEE